MASIIERVIGADRKRLGLLNDRFARKPDYPFGFPIALDTRIRIGIRCSFAFGGSNITGTPHLWMGLCNGDDTDADGNIFNVPGDQNINLAVGVRTNQSTWTFNNANPDYYKIDGGGDEWEMIGVAGGTERIATINAFTTLVSSEPDTTRNGWFVDLKKVSSSSWAMEVIHPNTVAAVQTDLSLANFNTQMAQNFGTTNLSGYAAIGLGTLITVPTEENNGNLDTVFVHWSDADVRIEISDLAVNIVG